MFAELGELHAGTVRIRLYAGPATGKPLLDRTVTAAELPFGAPMRSPLRRRPNPTARCTPWRSWPAAMLRSTAAAWRLAAQTKRRPLGRRRTAARPACLQTLYALPNQEPQPPSLWPARLGRRPRSAGALAWAAARRAVAAAREALRRARRAQDIVRAQGPAALLAEAVSYLRWRGL